MRPTTLTIFMVGQECLNMRLIIHRKYSNPTHKQLLGPSATKHHPKRIAGKLIETFKSQQQRIRAGSNSKRYPHPAYSAESISKVWRQAERIPFFDWICTAHSEGNDIRSVNALDGRVPFHSLKHTLPAGGRFGQRKKGRALACCRRKWDSVNLLGEAEPRARKNRLFTRMKKEPCAEWNWKAEHQMRMKRKPLLVVEVPHYARKFARRWNWMRLLENISGTDYYAYADAKTHLSSFETNRQLF